MKPEVLAGAWVIAANKVLSKFNTDDPSFEPFEAILMAGRAGELFSATRSMGSISGSRLESHSKDCQAEAERRKGGAESR
jgi:hypothetical protein